MQKKENTEKAAQVEESNVPAQAEMKDENAVEIEFTVLDTSFTYGEPRLEE